MYISFAILLLSGTTDTAATEENCEVCVKYLRKFINTLTPEVKTSPSKIEEEFKKFCLDAKGKDNRFCYYIGGLQDSATYILLEMARPISWSMPVEKVCDKLSKLDSQVCELKYDKQIDLKTVDLKKLKVKDLRKILDDWGETCEGCIEKVDFIKLIEKLKPKYMRDDL